MMDFITSHGLDIFTTVLGLVYILLEYRASIYLWLIGIVMPALDIWLYWGAWSLWRRRYGSLLYRGCSLRICRMEVWQEAQPKG